MKRWRLLLCATTACCMLAGCWDRRELNELGITAATSVDRSDKEWIVTYQVIVPSAMWTGAGGGGAASSSQSSVHVFTSRGSTIREAAGRANLEFTRQLYFSHTDVLVLGKEAAQHGISEVLDLFLRSFDSRETVLLTVTDGEASKIMRKLVPPEKLPGRAIASILETAQKTSGRTPAVKIFDVARSIYSDSNAILVPEIGLRRVDGGNEKDLEGVDAYKTTIVPTKLRLLRLGVFKGAKLVGWIDQEESYGLDWLNNRIKKSMIAFPCPGAKSEEEHAVFQVRAAKTHVVPVKAKDTFQINVRVKAKGALSESSCTRSLTDPATVSAMEKQIEKVILDDIRLGWSAAQRMHADLAGFADKIHRKYPDAWQKAKQDWERQLEQVELNIRVQATLENTGMLNDTVSEKLP
ncbi:Ger(x)C family spore germination protein [Cohnella ginsengisoli]|uniref:Ger(X)C family spore germination protein n=1 Tax=Cohnella ginsengisoli TaxID=425004 RepID=A0A9X4KPH6_9BACL|nr:Ger(x)C family spore germination protein [Cohnella ginsengisoli]MDG0793862.1 Ger(x)C family spore germination protein [Cohnella ginsengisoli]